VGLNGRRMTICVRAYIGIAYITVDSRYIESRREREEIRDTENFVVSSFTKILKKIGNSFEYLKY
jgi:hypothetical protein